MDIWRESGGYHLDGLEPWCPSHEGAEAIHVEALRYLDDMGAGANDVFSIQFG